MIDIIVAYLVIGWVAISLVSLLHVMRKGYPIEADDFLSLIAVWPLVVLVGIWVGLTKLWKRVRRG